MSGTSSRKPSILIYIGGVLWIAVFTALYISWTARSEEGSLSDGSTLDGAVVVTPGSEPLNADEDDPDGETKPVELKVSWPESGVADFSFLDRSGQSVSKNDLMGQPWIAGFIFTRCAGPCPKVTAAMQNLQKRYQGSDIRLVTLTVDPDNDTPEVLSKYADFWDAEADRWFFLTGDKIEIYNLIQKSFLMPVREEKDPEPGFEIIHTTNLCLVDQTGRVIGKYNSVVDKEVAMLRRDLDRLLQATAPTDDDSDGPESGEQSDG